MEQVYAVLDSLSYFGGLLFSLSFIFVLILFAIGASHKEKE